LLIVRPSSSNLVFLLWKVTLWAGTQEQMIPFPDFKCGAVSPGGKLLALASAGGGVLLWDVEHSRALATIQNGAARIARLQFSMDGRLLAITTENNRTDIWQVAPTNLVAQFAHRAPEYPDNVEWAAMCFSQDGRFYGQGEERGHAEVWDLTRRESVRFWKADGKWVSSMVFSPDGKTIVTTGYDAVVRSWDLATGKQRSEQFRTSNHASMLSLAFSPDGGRLVGVMADGSVKLWDTTSAQELLTLKGHRSDPEPNGTESVSFSPDGQTVVAASRLDLTRWPLGL
jgi:WD40 repeat protein